MSQFFRRSSGSGAPQIETITGNSGGPVGPDASFNINVLGDNTNGINIVGSPGTNTLTVSNNYIVKYTAIAVAASPYTVLSSDYYLGCSPTTGTITIQLPNAPSTGRTYVIKDKSGTSNTHNISVTTVGGAVNIDGGTTYTINVNYDAIMLLFNGTSYEVF